ncbi:hypothetical protein BC827DRAFT_1257716 [Russula dissimulans]|nr:hypothetical protein BC827DRAFT_1257716 [Russula dissimulans]
MSFKALVYAYVIGGLTFIPLLVITIIAYTLYTSVPASDPNATKSPEEKAELQNGSVADTEESTPPDPSLDLNDLPKSRRGWLTVRRTFQEVVFDGSYVTLMKSILDSRSKDPKRSRPRDLWYVVLKGKVLYLYEDEAMTECEAVIELSSHQVLIYPEGLPDGELFTKRNAICLKPKSEKGLPSVTREMQISSSPNVGEKAEERNANNSKKKQREKERFLEFERHRDSAREEASDPSTPWFIFMRSSVEMEDWYLSLIHASDHPAHSSTLTPLQSVFSPTAMSHLVAVIDEQPDIIPMRWLNALLGRIFFSYHNTDTLESYIIGRLMKKLAKVKRPNFLSEIVVTEANMGNRPVMFSKPMLKELTKEGDAALELHVQYKGEMRITIKAVATISLGFKPYTVKLVLAVVLRELEGNLVVRVKRPPSNRIWYAFTHMPKMVLNVEPVVSDRQITWGMILSTIESKLKEIILESVVLPNMDDIAFFDSSSYSYRGGIWPDAARREKSNLSSVSADPSTADDDVYTVSAPPDADSSSLSPGDADSNVKHSNSEGDVSIGPDPQRSSPQPSHNRPGLPPSRGSSPTPDPSYQSNPHEHDSLVEEPDLKTEAALLEVQHPQLRHKSSSSSEKSKRRFLGIRRTSQPNSLSHSSSREPSPAPSLERVSSPEPVNGVSPHHSDTRPKSPAPSSQSSLFSTLKSRAGDRQALSNTARETVRKWAVNWAGLKKDRDSSVASSEDAQDTRPRSASQKAKSSYAEIRAAVDGRREKERRSSDVAPAPIHIPDQRHNERAGSGSSTHNPQCSSLSSSQADSPVASSAGWSTGTWADETSHDPSSTQPPTIDVDGIQLGSPDIDKTGPPPVTIVVPPTPMDVPRPIQSQPSQGKTMIIPGIHARNRGEVMSMGYVPPSLLAPETKPGVSSVYRLWKHSPTTQSEHAEDIIDRAGSQSPPMLSADRAETSPEPSPTPTNNVRPEVPPLPPRTLPSVHSVPSEPSSMSPASAALKSIVSRNEESRVQDGEGIEASSSPDPPVSPKPPLPPRKIPTSA